MSSRSCSDNSGRGAGIPPTAAAETRQPRRTLRLPIGGVEITVLRTGQESGGAVFEFETLLPPWSSGPPAHWHRIEQETFEVVQGRLQVRVGQWWRVLDVGQSVTVPVGCVHAFANPSDEPARVITREQPAGQLEAQVRTMARARRLPPLLRLAEVNAAHGYSLVFAGVPDRPQRAAWQTLAALSRLRGAYGGDRG